MIHTYVSIYKCLVKKYMKIFFFLLMLIPDLLFIRTYRPQIVIKIPIPIQVLSYHSQLIIHTYRSISKCLVKKNIKNILFLVILPSELLLTAQKVFNGPFLIIFQVSGSSNLPFAVKYL